MSDGERTPEEKLRAVARNEEYSDRTREIAQRLLKRHQEGSR